MSLRVHRMQGLPQLSLDSHQISLTQSHSDSKRFNTPHFSLSRSRRATIPGWRVGWAASMAFTYPSHLPSIPTLVGACTILDIRRGGYLHFMPAFGGQLHLCFLHCTWCFDICTISKFLTVRSKDMVARRAKRDVEGPKGCYVRKISARS